MCVCVFVKGQPLTFQREIIVDFSPPPSSSSLALSLVELGRAIQHELDSQLSSSHQVGELVVVSAKAGESVGGTSFSPPLPPPFPFWLSKG